MTVRSSAPSIVAVEAKTGKYRWHFQQVHHDIWDYDAASPVTLFDSPAALVFDTSVFGNTGPVLGTRYRLEAAPTVGDLSYLTLVADYRRRLDDGDAIRVGRTQLAFVAPQHTAQTTATVISSAGDGALSVADASTTATGHLVNGTFSLPSALQAKASSAAGAGGAAFADVGGSAAPTGLLTYSGPTSNDAVTVAFQQHVGQTDALRTGAYNKPLTFTLSTTTP